jgi:hypothetical protein
MNRHVSAKRWRLAPKRFSPSPSISGHIAQIAPELLPKQHLDIRFIIDHEDKKIHRCVPICLPSINDTDDWANAM